MRDIADLNDVFENALSELKRAEHLIFVTLKYNRTRDVLERILERLVSALSYLIDLLIMLKTSEEFNAAKKIDLLLELYEHHPYAEDVVKYYNLLRLIKKRDKVVLNPFRKHLKLITNLAPSVFYIVDLDSVVENFNLIKSFIDVGHQYLMEYYYQNYKQTEE